MRRDLRLVPFAVVSWASAFVSISIPIAALGVAIGLWCATGMVLWLSVRRRRGQATEVRVPRMRSALALSAACMALAAVTASHVALAQGERTGLDAIGLAGGRAVAIEAQVTSKVEVTKQGALRFDADAWQIGVGSRVIPLRVPVTITVDPAAVTTRAGETLDLGSTVRASGTSKRTEPPRRSVLLVFASRGVEVLRGPPWPLALAADTRTAFVDRSATLPAPGGDLLPGLAVGDTRAAISCRDLPLATPAR